MTFKKLIPAAIMAIAATTANAGGFDGPFVQLGIGGSSTWSKTSNTEPFGTGASLNGTSSSGSFNGIILGGYSQDLGIIDPSIKGLNLAANIFYVIGNQNAGSRSSSGAIGDYSQTLNINNAALKNTFGISVEPGWNFTENTLGYLKFAWLNSRMSAGASFSDYNGYDNTSDSFNFIAPSSTTINGFGYGLGAKYLITKNIFAGIDLMGVTYGSSSPTYTAPTPPCDSECSGNPSIKNTQFMGFASIGYKF